MKEKKNSLIQKKLYVELCPLLILCLLKKHIKHPVQEHETLRLFHLKLSHKNDAGRDWQGVSGCFQTASRQNE